MSTSVKRKDVKEVVPTKNGSDKTQQSVESETLNKNKEKEDRQSLVLWKRPFSTLEYSFRECLILLITYGKR